MNLKAIISFAVVGLMYISLTLTNCHANILKNNTNFVASKIEENHDIRINLESTKNTRDLGNYKTFSSQITRCKTFLRSDNTNCLTESDIQKLTNEYNLKTVIDLRSNSGVKKTPDKLSEVDGITYHHIPLMISNKEIVRDLFEIAIKKSDVGKVYTDILSHKDSIKKIFDTITDSEDGCILFHCTHGKDRTGIVASLLLDLVGVSRKDIIENYAITSELLDADCETKISLKTRIDRYFKSLPVYIDELMNYIDDNYGSTTDYLLSCGISQENLDKIKNRFVI